MYAANIRVTIFFGILISRFSLKADDLWCDSKVADSAGHGKGIGSIPTSQYYTYTIIINIYYPFYHFGGFVGPVPILELSQCYICRSGCTGIMSGMSTCKCRMSGRLAEWKLTFLLSYFLMFIVICLFSRLYGDEQAID